MHALLTALKTTLRAFALFLAVILFLLGLMLTTTPGLYVVVKISQLFLPGQLTIGKLHGRLLNQFSADQLVYDNKDIHIDLSHISLNWHALSFLHKKIHLTDLQADTLKITLKDTPASIKPAVNTPFSFPQLPFVFTLQKGSIQELQVIRQNNIQRFSNIQLQAELNKQLWTIQQLEFDFNYFHFALQSTMQPILPYAVTANVQISSSGIINVVKGTVTLGGDLTLYHWHAELTRPAHLTMNGTLRNGHEFHLLALWTQLMWWLDPTNKLESSKGKLQIDGSLPDLAIKLITTVNAPLETEWHLNAQTSQQGIQASSTVTLAQGIIDFLGAYNNNASPKMSGKIKADSLDLRRFKIPLEQLKGTAQFKGNSLNDLSLTLDLTARYLHDIIKTSLNYKQQILQGKLALGSNQLTVSGTFPYQWRAKADILAPELLHPGFERLQTAIHATATLDNVQKGQFHLTIKPGNYKLPDDSMVSALSFQGGQFNAVLNDKKLQAKGDFIVDEHKKFTLALLMPQFSLAKPNLTKQAIQGNLKLAINSLSFLEGLSKDIAKPQGQLNAVLKASGTIGKPVVNGTITLNKASVSLPKAGLTLNPVEIQVKSNKRHWEATGSVSSNGQITHLHGQGEFSPQLKGTMTIAGDNIPVINSPEYSINLTPQLTIEFTPTTLAMKGKILVPQAKIRPQTFNETVSMTNDAVFVGEEPPPNPLNINTDIRVEMGNEVVLDVKGLHGTLAGGIHVFQAPHGPLNASGELYIREGKYKAYGQNLVIEEGQLLFTGGLLENPSLRVRALRSFDNANSTLSGSNQLFDFNSTNLQTLDFGNKTTVGIEVSGPLNSPKVQLFSIPANLSQADILSMLLLGKPAHQANKAGGQLLMTAISAMNLDSGTGGTQLLEQLKQSMGIDFDLETNSQYNRQTNKMTDKTSFVVGKSLSKRLYISYTLGLSQADSNVLTLKYLLNKFFSIQVSTSDDSSGIDLLYTHKKD